MTKALVEELRAKAQPLSMRQAEFVEHLLATPGDPEGQDAADCMFRAADHIEAISSENEKLKAALEPFAKYIEARDENDADIPDDASAISYATSFRGPVVTVTFGDFRRAALKGEQ